MDGADEIVARHTDLVRALAVDIRASLELRAELDDLVGYGFAGLLEARERFDGSQGASFETFAYYRIRGAILDGVRKMSSIPRRTYDRCRRVAAEDAASEAIGFESGAVDDIVPSDPDDAEDLEAASSALDALVGRVAASFIAAAAAQEERRGPEAALISEIEQVRLKRALTTLPAREQRVVRGVYFEELLLDDLGRELGLSRSVVSRIHTRALGMLRESLG